jgi:hypothetical protein
MTALAVVVALDPDGQIALQLLRSDQLFAIVIEVQLQLLLRRSLQLEGGEKLSATALSQQQPLADMLQPISCFSSRIL